MCLCAIYERAGRIPKKPKTVYRKIVNLLLEEWDEQRSVVRNSKYSSFEVDRKMEFLANLAFHLTTKQRSTEFTRNDLLSAYKQIYQNFNLPKNEAVKVVEELESHTGLFVQAGHELYEFAHKSVQEFLTAEYLVRLPFTPDSNRIISSLSNELAIATAISSNSSEYLAHIVFDRLVRIEAISSEFVRPFVTRLLIEKPDFPKSSLVGAALLTLHTMYLTSSLRASSQLQLFVMDDLGPEFEQLYRSASSLLNLDEVLRGYKFHQMTQGADGVAIAIYHKAHLPNPYAEVVGKQYNDGPIRRTISKSTEVAFTHLPEVLVLRDSLIKESRQLKHHNKNLLEDMDSYGGDYQGRRGSEEIEDLLARPTTDRRS